MKTAADLVANAKSRIQEISVEQAKQAIENGEVTLLDARSDMEWAAGHLPGANHADRGRLEFVIHQMLPNLDQNIIIYCRSGGRSALAADVLQTMGYTNVQSLAGGITAWQEYGFPITE